jgi:hypothetical protein
VPGQPLRLVNCPRGRDDVNITISGSSFGANQARVFVGGVECGNTRQPASPLLAQQQVTCTAPRNSRLGVAVLVLQKNGAPPHAATHAATRPGCELTWLSDCSLCRRVERAGGDDEPHAVPGWYPRRCGQLRQMPAGPRKRRCWRRNLRYLSFCGPCLRLIPSCVVVCEGICKPGTYSDTMGLSACKDCARGTR